MITRARFSQVVICVVALFGSTSVAQNVERRQTNPSPQAQEQPPNANPTDAVSNEIGLLRKSLQTLNVRLREISDRLFTPDAKPGGPSDKTEDRISRNLDLLSRTEQRAELLRKLLIELIEKETAFKTRLVQVEEDLRPESIDRAVSLVGSTRTPELRDVRRRVLENERRGVESLLNQTSQSRLRLEEDVKLADALVYRLRQRLLPLIEKEIDKINPEQ